MIGVKQQDMSVAPAANPTTLQRYRPRIAQSCDRSDEHAAPPVFPEPRDQEEQNSVRQLGPYQRRATNVAADEEHQWPRQDDVENTPLKKMIARAL